MIMIEIDLRKLERGLRREKVKVHRKTGTTYEYRRVGQKEEEKPFASWKQGDPYPEELEVGAIADLGKFGKYKIVDIVGGSVKCDNGRYYGISDLSGIIKKSKPEKPKVTKKPEVIKEPEKPVEYKDAPGIKGSVPTYESLPSTFILGSGFSGQTQVYRKESKASGIEVGSGINVIESRMVLSMMEKGGDGGILIRGKTKYGSYHTHPDPAIDTFSLEDVLGLFSVHPINLAMAHTVSSNNLWVAVASADTREMISKMEVNDLIKMKDKYRKMSNMAVSLRGEKGYRKFVKKFCDEYKVGLYVGKPNEELKKYDGSW